MGNEPLPEKLRPKKIIEFVGQNELIGKDGIIKTLINNAKKTSFFPSLIFWGPPGSGKTTLARIIASELKRPFYEFSAVSTSIKEIEKIMQKGNLFPPIVVIDEIHRFNKAQQAKLLPFVERGDITLVGATTENPSFEVIAPLLSRTRVLTLKQHTEKELKKIITKALKYLKVEIEKDALTFLIESSNGDARVALTVLEIAHNLTTQNTLLTSHIEQALQRRQYTFDKKGEDYYNVISAFIKSMRASDVDAALYYLARMVEAGQDPLYIARRMVVFASEDIGMAQPTALVIANEVFRACETIGYPECQINLMHGVVYLALAKKDRSVYNAYMSALSDVHKYGNLPVLMKVRNPVTKLMKEVGYGEGYEKYTKESLLPEKLKDKKYYRKLE
ncbi:AAA family ATPase [Candidatus Woesebacteria bacterium RIFCSPLOWO2_01_FULL_39_61]|uniref:AAA family ATPase n=1 Tax=Candidatus Woesebacteria bacterium RIFCSPHIGHO2_02_FULL_39_13 TaxID=1802505 RepID=A0A1F7Z108_9BACT|nr:MAG: AAA family ATPase [Candidatus Woesebacteria bacterium RIFCSPHIGHO2_01_FULL_39_95]OGM32375.1 MAG: AAA family ATPase [Candidatus Woesebacteria bacterium RIFCSPHIGHO2_02_FULL_39_13]OGM37562.1 MAG: AAA family ATPase [Candidatus Woesebacteria bacterium RIFCSPHIGHO2_12_FULL_40_20]OGM65637.1 MAG: AAA family ATPase [Candidatus Woesebacteria bacterium RIFCSPLOWO2_01_FULL_39_61]